MTTRQHLLHRHEGAHCNPWRGYLGLVLHAHLPFVRHPENKYMLEENWLFEAITETYLPLLDTFETLLEDRVPFRLTMSLTPTLCAMFQDPLLQTRYLHHLDKLIELAGKEIRRTRGDPEFNAVANMYRDRFLQLRDLYTEGYHGDLTAAFKRFQELGSIELITCCATHAYLPNMQHSPTAVQAQVSIAADEYRRIFNRDPEGIWLPECGYFPGLEAMLAKEKIRYFFVDTHALLFANPRPVYGAFAPVVCPEAAVAAFSRDAESSKAVWSADEGYPGHPLYREHYRDIGYDLDMDYIRPYIDPIGNRIQTGIKYFRVTKRNSPEKEPYHRIDALRIADDHAADFLLNRERQAADLRTLMDRPPLIISPYDAELFGHWWYEGPQWLNFLFRKLAFEQETLSLITPSDYLALHPENPHCQPSFSSWGEGGFSGMWLDKSNDWVCRHLTPMEERMSRAARRHAHAKGILRRALNQMARELLLAESSDWPFIMKTGTTVQYAVRRVKEHIAAFNRLYEAVEKNAIAEPLVSSLEARTPIFPNIDYKIYK